MIIRNEKAVEWCIKNLPLNKTVIIKKELFTRLKDLEIALFALDNIFLLLVEYQNYDWKGNPLNKEYHVKMTIENNNLN